MSLVAFFLLDFSQLVEGVSPREGNDSLVKKSQPFCFVAGLGDWDDVAVLASEVLVSLEGDGLEGCGFGKHWGLITEHWLGVIWFVLNGFELGGLLLDSSVGSAVDSGVARELWDWDVAASVCRQD